MRFSLSSSHALLEMMQISNLVPSAHVSFGQRQDTCLGADQKTRGLWGRDWQISYEMVYNAHVQQLTVSF